MKVMLVFDAVILLFGIYMVISSLQMKKSGRIIPGLIAILCMVAIVIFIAKRSRKEFDEEYELHSKGTGATA